MYCLHQILLQDGIQWKTLIHYLNINTLLYDYLIRYYLLVFLTYHTDGVGDADIGYSEGYIPIFIIAHLFHKITQIKVWHYKPNKKYYGR